MTKGLYKKFKPSNLNYLNASKEKRSHNGLSNDELLVKIFTDILCCCHYQYLCKKHLGMRVGTLAEFLNMGGSEIMLILVIVLLLFGGKKLPELARGLGRGIREFKEATDGAKQAIHKNINDINIEENKSARTIEIDSSPHDSLTNTNVDFSVLTENQKV